MELHHKLSPLLDQFVISRDLIRLATWSKFDQLSLGDSKDFVITNMAYLFALSDKVKVVRPFPKPDEPKRSISRPSTNLSTHLVSLIGRA